MATQVQSGFRSPSELHQESSSSLKGIPKSGSESQLKPKKSLGKKIKEWFKKPFTKASTATEIPFDQRTDISSSQNLDKPVKQTWNPYQHPAHGQIFIPGSIAVIRNGQETVAYVPGNIAVAVNRPGMDMNSVPMLLATNQQPVLETDPVMEETPKLVGEQSPKWEEMSPKYDPADTALKMYDIQHMNEKEAEAYKNMRESRMLYATNTYVPNQTYQANLKRSTIKFSEADRESIRGSRTFA